MKVTLFIAWIFTRPIEMFIGYWHNMNVSNKKQQTITSLNIRRIIIEQSMRAHVGHIGSALSIADIIAVLYGSILQIPHPDHPERDRFILSKGHAALALYAALNLKGWLTDAELNTYCADDSLLGVHPECALKGVDFCSGSLGQGLSIGAGAALGARITNSIYRVFVLVSDAECNEGSLWEAVMFAAHHRLSNLVVIVDLNGQQALDFTNKVLDLSPMVRIWNAFGWDVHEVDGHNVEEMTNTIIELDTLNGLPHVLIARTIFGMGVSYMKNKIKWHYWPMTDDEYHQAIEEINKA